MEQEYRIARILNYIVNRNRSNISAELKKVELTHADARILLILNHQGKLLQDDLVKQMYIDKSAVTRMLQNLIKKGYIKKEISNEDRRFAYVELTMDGKSMLPVIETVFEKHNQQMLLDFTKEEEHTLRCMLEKITKNVGGIHEFK